MIMTDDAPRSWREGDSLRRGDTWLLVADPWLSIARCASAAMTESGFSEYPNSSARLTLLLIEGRRLLHRQEGRILRTFE